MNFQNAIKSDLKNWLDFKGRASRSEYWYWSLLVIGILFVTMSLDHLIFRTSGFTQGPLSSIANLVVLIPHLSLAFRRLHDRNKSAWWLLIGLIPLVGGIILLIWFCQKGTDGSNRFGPDPLAFDNIIS